MSCHFWALSVSCFAITTPLGRKLLFAAVFFFNVYMSTYYIYTCSIHTTYVSWVNIGHLFPQRRERRMYLYTLTLSLWSSRSYLPSAKIQACTIIHGTRTKPRVGFMNGRQGTGTIELHSQPPSEASWCCHSREKRHYMLVTGSFLVSSSIWIWVCSVQRLYH